MKKFVPLLILVLSIFLQYRLFPLEENKSQPVKVMMDPRMELMSQIFRLAGRTEYNNGRIESYNNAVDMYFSGYKEHDVVKLARKLSQSRGVSFDAVMNMAAHITNVEDIQEKAPFNPRPLYLDRRWEIPEAREFLEAARRFVRDSDFNAFLEKNQDLYNTTIKRMKKLLQEQGHMEWFDNFFGPRNENRFFIVPGLLNDGHSYGVRFKAPDNSEELYCVLGVWLVDKDGLPTYDKTVFSTIVHEFCHSYVNPLVDKYEPYLKKSGEQIYASVSDAMNRQHYGNWKIMIYESIVRAGVARYVQMANGPEEAKKLVLEEIDNKFILTDALYKLMGEYETQRKEYPTFESFFPKITALIDKYAADQGKAPKMVSSIPENGAKDVDPGLQFIVIRFDHRMKDRSWSIVGEGLMVPTPNGEPFYLPGRMVLNIPVKLHPGWKYDFWLNSEKRKGFMSDEYEPLEPVHIQFSTIGAEHEE